MNGRRENPIVIRREARTILYALMAAGSIALAFGMVQFPQRTWAVLLLNAVYFLTLAVSGIFFIAIQYVTRAGWGVVVRRIPEAISGFLPYGALMMLVLCFGIHILYPWAQSHEVGEHALSASKASYLSVPFFIFRSFLIIGIWVLFSKIIRRNSILEDEIGGEKPHRSNVRLSAIFIIVFAITFSIATFDWIMSLEPHWYSTIFAIYNWSGMFVHGIAAVALIAIILNEGGYLPELRKDHVHDLGKLLMAFTFFWAYIWYSQFVLIWYGNIPEETIYFVHRLEGDWHWLFYTNLFMNFVVPFFILLPRSVKRNPAMVKRVCVLLLVGRWLDLYLMIAPGALREKAFIGVVEVLITLGLASLFVLVVRRELSKADLVPRKSPFIEESLAHHQ